MSVFFEVVDSSAENTYVSIIEEPTPFVWSNTDGTTVVTATSPGLITIGGGGSSVDDVSDSGDGGVGDGGTAANQAPTLALVDPSVTTHEAGTIWQDPGASATDTEDDDAVLTSAIEVTGTVNEDALSTYTLTYDVTDSGGLDAQSISRTVEVVDTTAPVIYLNGATSVSHPVGVDYTDLGAVATDSFE